MTKTQECDVQQTGIKNRKNKYKDNMQINGCVMKNTYRIYQIIFLLIIIALSGCIGETGIRDIPESDCPIPASPQFQYVSNDALANAISADVGRVSASIVGDPEKRIIVFEESHDSRAGQIEIAIMLNRLHDKGLKVIALEGALVTEKDLYPEWFHRLPNMKVKQEVAVQLLKEGEISATEFIALLYPDVKIYGVENTKEYSVVASENASLSLYSYLLAIAEKNMSQDQISKANQLYKQENYTEFYEFVTDASTCTKRWYGYFTNANRSFIIEEEISVLDDVKKGATLVNAEIDQNTKADFEEWIESFKIASNRSNTMVANTLISVKDANAPIALNIGAGHTSYVSELLKDNRVTYAIIAPNSLADTNDISKLNSSAYNRKLERLSVDESGMLGSFLDNRPKSDNQRKPPPVIPKVFISSKSELYYITKLVARGAASGRTSPFGLENEFSMLKYVKVNPESIKVIDNDVTFSAEILDDNNNKKTIYTRAHLVEIEEKEKTVEELLKEALNHVRDEKSLKEEKEDKSKGLSKPSRDTLARHSPNPNSIKVPLI